MCCNIKLETPYRKFYHSGESQFGNHCYKCEPKPKTSVN